VTDALADGGTATAIAREIKARIREETGLTASAGVSYNKFLAKLASDHRKPDGLFVITPAMGPAFVETLPIGKFHGVGPATAAKMAELGIHTGTDLRRQTRQALTARFGKIGDYYYAAARGEDDRPVIADSPRKSIGAETTFQRDLTQWDDATAALEPLFAKVWVACERTGLVGRTVTVKVKYADFQQITRSRSSADPIATQAMIERMGLDLLRPLFPSPRGVRLLGVTVSHLDDVSNAPRQQLALPIG
jgi:DNA polymerase-4